MPFLSPLLVKPRNLGIQADIALVKSFDAKFGMKNELPGGIVPDNREPEYSGRVQLDTTLTSQEITSILAYWRGQYKKTPIRDVQVRFNPDGTGEISGILEIATAIGMAKQLGYSDSEIEKGKTYVQLVAGDIPFYAHGVAGVTQNNVTIRPSTLEVGRFRVPSSLVTPISDAVADAIERRMNDVGGINITSAKIEKEAFRIMGTVPNTIK